jgi:hypothetical protein
VMPANTTMRIHLSCLLLALASLPSPAQAAGHYRIAGTVVNAVSGEPVRRATVAVLGLEDGRTILSAQSDNDGHFSLPNLPAAKYQLTAFKRGFRTAFYDEHDEFSSAIVTAEGQDTSNLTFRLTPASVLHGVVTGDGGDPVANASVLLFVKPHGHSPGERIAEADSTTTDDTGAYEFGDLASGEYLLAVKAEPWYALHRSVSRALSDGGTSAALDVAYPVTYYDSTTEEASATAIMLAGGNREEANLSLHAVPALHLVVEAPRNQAGTIAQPELHQTIFGTQLATQSASPPGAGQTGTIEFTGVAPGQYELTQGDPPRLAQLDASVSQEVDPSLGAPLVAVSGTLRTASGASLPYAAMVTLSRLDGPYSQEPVRVISSNGAFYFPAPALSVWELTAEGTGKNQGQPLAVVSTTVGSRTRQGNRITVRDRPLTLEVTVSEGETRVEGFARDGSKGFAGAMIVLVPRNRPAAAFASLLRRDQSDSDGSFSLHDVVPGSYTVVAIQDGWALDWSRPEVIGRYLPAGIAVTVSAESGKIVQLSRPVPVQNR